MSGVVCKVCVLFGLWGMCVCVCVCEIELHVGLRTTQNTQCLQSSHVEVVHCVCVVRAVLSVPWDAYKSLASRVKAGCTLAGLHPV